MKKRFSILIVGAVVAGMVLSLVGMALVSQAASAEKGQNSYRQTPKPILATDVHLVKKTPLPPVVGEVKGKPTSPPGQDKDKNKESEEGAATGILGSEVTGNKYALVIGICDYPGTRNDLCWSDGDSLRMYKALTTLYGYDAENVRLFKDGGGTTGFEIAPEVFKSAGIPTRQNILGAINKIKELVTSPDDEVVFFFSGHGADGIAGDGDNERRDEGIVVWNDENDVEGNITYIWDGELKTAFSGFDTTRIAFVFDTCLAGGMDDLAAEGRVISMGTSETSVSYVYSSDLFNLRTSEMEDVDGDDISDGEGVFTRYFVNEGMLLGEADKYNHSTDDSDDLAIEKNKEDVVIEEAFDYAKEIIPSIWKRQKPTISDKFDNDLLL